MRTALLVLAGALAACQTPPAASPEPAEPGPALAPAGDPPPELPPAPEPDFDTPIEASFSASRCREEPPPTPVGDVDWCNADLQDGLAHLRDGIGELHEYEQMGGPHDTHIFRLVDLIEFSAGGRIALLVREEDSFANGAHSSSLRLNVYERVGQDWKLADTRGLTDAPEASLSASGAHLHLWTRHPERACRHDWSNPGAELAQLCVEARKNPP